MPFNSQNIKSIFYKNSNNYEFNNITIDLDQANREYIPFAVHKIYNTNIVDIDDISNDINLNQYAVLTNQEIKTENGLYQKISSNGVSQLSNPINDTFYLDVSSNFKRAIYINETNDFLEVYFNKVLLGTSLSTTLGTSLVNNEIFNYPIPYSRPVYINTNINGINENNILFDGQYKTMFYNTAGTSIIKLNNFNQITNRSNPSSFSLPTVSFGICGGTSSGILNFVSNNSNGVSWFIKSEMYF